MKFDKSMKLSKRLILISVGSLLSVFLLFVLLRDLLFMKSLVIERQLKSEEDLKLLTEQEVSPKDFIKADTKSMGSKTMATVSSSTPVKVSKPRINKFKHLHKFSLYNPNFRQHTDWPPFFSLPDNNPNLASIWNLQTTDDMPNWKKFQYQISKYYLYEDIPMIDELLHDVATKKIVAVAEHPGGTQFKLVVVFEDGGAALFKPMRYPREKDVHQNILYFSDYERHISEIAAFHLDRILGFRRVPPVVGRKVNVTGLIYRLADEKLRDTFYITTEGNYCFHGTCLLFCDVHHGFCGNPDMIEGSFSVYLPVSPQKLLAQRLITSPWRRTYTIEKTARWEVSPKYCSEVVIRSQPFTNHSRRLYDVIDCAIFDYLIGNQDRHHYDEFSVFGTDHSPTLIHLDNGRGFGRADTDEPSIIMPLLQCCVIRLSTFNKLYSFYAGPKPLSQLMRESLAKDPIAPILTEPHLQALDRRVEKIILIISSCIRANQPSVVLLDDIL